jgi:replicative DNA helicase
MASSDAGQQAAATQQVGRPPPHSIEAEQAALGSVLIKPACLDDLGSLEINDFFMPVHQEILDAMRAIAARGWEVDFVGLSDELKTRDWLRRMEGGENYLLTLAHATPTAENVKHYVDIVASKATLRRAIAFGTEMASRAYGEVSDVEEFLNEARVAVSSLEIRGGGGPVRVGAAMDRVIAGIEKIGDKPQEFLVPTGIASVDRRIGGLFPGLVIVAARPGGGKSAFSVNNVAVDAALAGIPTLVFSLEMEIDEVIPRALARRAGINGRNVRLGQMDMQQWIRLHRAQADFAEIPLEVDDRDTLKTSQICAEARRWRARNPGPRALIVIDYVGLVEADKEERVREREVAKMTKAFKRLSKKAQANCPVIVCCQLNRDSVDKTGKIRAPNLRDLRESGAIEQDADIVIFPWWESKPPASGRHPAEIIFGKYRGAHAGVIKVDWQPELTAFCDRLEEDDPQEDLPL